MEPEVQWRKYNWPGENDSFGPERQVSRARSSAVELECYDMPDRIRCIHEQGKEILLVDMSNCPPSEVESIARIVPSHVTARARGSVLLLVDFSGAAVDAETVRTMKESAVFDKPYIKKSAWFGTKSLPKDFHTEITKFARREMVIFNSRAEAVDWLVRD